MPSLPRLLPLALLPLLAIAGTASAQTTFDVIGPREYELPVGFEPFNVFVQYATYQDNARVFDADGNRVDGSGSKALTGLSKYVRFWTPESNKKIGVAWEVIVPEVAIRNRRAPEGDRHISGIGDPQDAEQPDRLAWRFPAQGIFRRQAGRRRPCQRLAYQRSAPVRPGRVIALTVLGSSNSMRWAIASASSSTLWPSANR